MNQHKMYQAVAFAAFVSLLSMTLLTCSEDSIGPASVGQYRIAFISDRDGNLDRRTLKLEPVVPG